MLNERAGRQLLHLRELHRTPMVPAPGKTTAMREIASVGHIDSPNAKDNFEFVKVIRYRKTENNA
jgi:hypothetical protein